LIEIGLSFEKPASADFLWLIIAFAVSRPFKTGG
jgi:hypothetical protein